ncbi:thiolase-like protein [Phaeosphaeriaceae sp. PMI808]|nr:thiolase-like protein [Phaeosphaeriaceae sp. PMI808]
MEYPYPVPPAKKQSFEEHTQMQSCHSTARAHGTGTEVGDGIEIDVFSRVLEHKSGEPIMIGSIKTNLGHSGAVSGISSLIKMTLALETGIITQTIGVKTPDGDVHRASLNSFEYGGSNGHVVLENAQVHVPPSSPVHSERLLCRVIPLSSRSVQGLDNRRAAISNVDDSIDLGDVAYTLSCRRSHFENRGFLIATEQGWRSDILQVPLKTAVAPKQITPTLFAFTGQGAQWAQWALHSSIPARYLRTQ